MAECNSMAELAAKFQDANDQQHKFIGVRVSMEDYPQPEIIINTRENFDKKFAYYHRAYNEDLTLKANSNIKITGVASGDSIYSVGMDFGYYDEDSCESAEKRN